MGTSLPHASVTVAIPAFNAQLFLADALRSVEGQTYPWHECLVIDDGSTDNTHEVAASFPFVRYLRQPNGGDANARNRAIQEATGEFIAFLDSDDVWLPEKLERQIALFEARPEIGMVYTGVRVVDRHLRYLEELRPAPSESAFRNTLLVEKPYMTGVGSSGMVRTEVAREIWFDERLKASADWAFACRVSQINPVAPVDQPLVLYRQHAESQVHLNLRAVEADMTLTWREIFADPSLDPSIAACRRRGQANLWLSLAASYYKQGDRRSFLRYLSKSLVTRPDRVVSAFWRRYMGVPA